MALLGVEGVKNENGLRNALKYAYIKIYRAPGERDDSFKVRLVLIYF